MDAAQARDHVRMLDGIVRSADRSLRIPPTVLIGIGLVCTTVLGLIQARQMGAPIPPDQYIQPPAFLLMLAVVALVARRGRRYAGSETLLDGYAGIVFLAIFVVALTLNVTAQHRIISAEGMGLVWAGGFSAALLITGAMGSRPLLVGGIAMLAATASAGLASEWLPGLLAIGWFAGFVVPGIALVRGGAHGRAAAL